VAIGAIRDTETVVLKHLGTARPSPACISAIKRTRLWLCAPLFFPSPALLRSITIFVVPVFFLGATFKPRLAPLRGHGSSPLPQRNVNRKLLVEVPQTEACMRLALRLVRTGPWLLMSAHCAGE
jgi:hypothetical protein